MESLTLDRAVVPLAVAPTGRFYKSRKSRPCDACRRRKIACDMPAGPPCHRCLCKTQSCTFEHGPGQRKRPTHVRPAATTVQSPFPSANHRPAVTIAPSFMSALWNILDPPSAWSLIQLYTRFVDPYFPILSRHQMPPGPDTLSNMPLALLTAVCATTLPLVVYDRSLLALLLRPPSSEQLYRLCWMRIEQELHAPSLGTLQACLLLQQRLPTNLYLNDTAFTWSLMATAVSVKKGRTAREQLYAWRDHLPASLWFRPRQQAWPQAQVTIRSTLADGAINSFEGRSASGDGRDLDGLEGRNHNSRGQSDGFSRVDNSQRLDGNASLYLSYIVTHMTLFRAMLQPLNRVEDADAESRSKNQSQDHQEPSTQTVMHGALQCVREFVEFVETLTPTQWNAFWHGWSRANFSMAGSFTTLPDPDVAGTVDSTGSAEAMENAGRQRTSARTKGSIGSAAKMDVTTTARPGFEAEYSQLLGWVKRWRWASRVSANGAGAKGLPNLGLLRVESFLGQFGELEEII